MSELKIMDAEEYCMSSFSVGKVVWDKDNPDEIETAIISLYAVSHLPPCGMMRWRRRKAFWLSQ